MELFEEEPFGEFLIRKIHLQESDIPQMIEVLNAVYSNPNISFDENYVRWKYMNNPDGKTRVYHVLTSGGEIAATRSAIPQIFLINGKPVKTFLSADAGTKPQYRKKNLYLTIQYKHMSDHGKDTFILAYPGYESIAFQLYRQKLNWQLLSKVKPIFLPFSRLRPLVAPLKRRFRKKNLEIRPVERFGTPLNEYLAAKQNYSVPIMKKYTAELLNWWTVDSRQHDFFLHTLHAKGDLIGFLVYIKRGRYHAEILKLDFNRDEHYTSYLGEVMEYVTAQTGARLIDLWEPRQPAFHRALEALGCQTNHTTEHQYGLHFFPALIYSEQTKINGVDIFDERNFELDIFTRDFV